MSKLEDFLKLTDVSEVREVVKEKIGEQVFEFTIRPMTEREHSEFQQRSRKITGKNFSFDDAKYNGLLLDACVVEPNFRDADFLKNAKCATAQDFWNKKIPAGIISDLAMHIQKLSGFETLELEIENAKN